MRFVHTHLEEERHEAGEQDDEEVAVAELRPGLERGDKVSWIDVCTQERRVSEPIRKSGAGMAVRPLRRARLAHPGTLLKWRVTYMQPMRRHPVRQRQGAVSTRRERGPWYCCGSAPALALRRRWRLAGLDQGFLLLYFCRVQPWSPCPALEAGRRRVRPGRPIPGRGTSWRNQAAARRAASSARCDARQRQDPAF